MEEQELNQFTEFLGYIAEDSGKDLQSLIDELGEEGLTEAYNIFKEQADNFKYSEFKNTGEESDNVGNEEMSDELQFAAKGKKLMMIKKKMGDCGCGKKVMMKIGGKLVEKCNCNGGKMEDGGEVKKPTAFNYQMKRSGKMQIGGDIKKKVGSSIKDPVRTMAALKCGKKLKKK